MLIEWLEKHQLPCFYHRVLGFECPGCGFQHAFILLLKGEWLESLKVYPALLPLIFLGILLVMHLLTGKPGWRVIRRVLQFDLVIVLGSWMLKWFI